MSTVITLGEPFKSYFEKLDAFEIGICSTFPDQVSINGWPLNALPKMDKDEARAIAIELDAATRPIIEKFKQRKMAEVIALLQGNGPRGSTLVVR